MLDVCGREGYAGTVVAQVIRRAGSSRSTFYEHFADIEQCFLATILQIAADLRAVAERRIAQAPPQQAPLEAAQAVLDFAIEDQARARVLFTESLAGATPTQDLRDELIDALAAAVEDRWRADIAHRPTYDVPAKVMIGGVFRVLAFRARRGASGLHALPEAVAAWIEAFALADDGSPQWQHAGALEALTPPMAVSVEPMLPPPALSYGRKGLRAREVARNHRARLLHATAECIYSKGYAYVSVTDIVKAAHVSRGVFYNHFHDKQAAAMEAMQHLFEVTLTALAAEFFAASGWPSQVWAAARSLSHSYAAAPTLVYLGTVEGYAVGQDAIQLIEDRIMAFTMLLEQGYHHRAQAENLPRTISEITASASLELGYREVRRRQPRHISHLLPQLAYITLAPFMGASEATAFVRERMSMLDAAAPSG